MKSRVQWPNPKSVEFGKKHLLIHNPNGTWQPETILLPYSDVSYVEGRGSFVSIRYRTPDRNMPISFCQLHAWELGVAEEYEKRDWDEAKNKWDNANPADRNKGFNECRRIEIAICNTFIKKLFNKVESLNRNS